MRPRRSRSGGVLAGVGMTLVIAACGSGRSQAVHEPRGTFPVGVATASFPPVQKISQHTHLVISVRNSGHKTIPDVAVTICNVTCSYPAPKGEGTSAQAFASDIGGSDVAAPSRPIWIVDRGPGACHYSCQNGGAGAGVTASSNTWALGALKPGQTARFDWSVTAVQAGKHVVAWQVAAGLDGRAKAVLGNGSAPHGAFIVHVDTAPEQFRVDSGGQVVTTN